MRQIHPLSFRRPCGAMGKSKKRDTFLTLFLLCWQKKKSWFEGTTDVRRAAALRRFFPLCAMFKGTLLINRANSPFSPTLTAQWEKAKSVVFAFSRVKYKTESFAFSRVKIKTKIKKLKARFCLRRNFKSHANLAERDGCDLPRRKAF